MGVGGMVTEEAEPRSCKELGRDWHPISENYVVSLAFSEAPRRSWGEAVRTKGETSRVARMGVDYCTK